jgi:O-antigen ligase
MNATAIRRRRDQVVAINPLTTRPLRLAQLILPVVSFEFVFVLFLFSGQYKADPRFEWIPYDATVFWGVVNAFQALVLVLTPRLHLNRVGVPSALAGGLFALYVVGSLTWSDGVHYATYKAAYICTICVWCLCATALIISSSTTRLMRFFRLMLLFSGWVAIECLLFYVRNSQFGRVVQVHAMGNEGAYIGLGRIVAGGALVCGSMWMFGVPSNWGLWKSSLATLVALLFFVVSSAITGARGPVIAAVLAITVAGVFLYRGTSHFGVAKRISRLGIMVAIGVAALYVYRLIFGDLPLLVMRLLAFWQSSEYYDVSGQSFTRLDLFAEALRAWLEHPLFGHGIGSFPIIWENLDERLFPHNLILELLCELGLVGLLLFMAIPAAACFVARHELKAIDLRLKALLIAFAGYTFANTMTSGDIPDNRIVFMAVGLLAFRQVDSTRQSRQKLTLGYRPTFPKFSRPPCKPRDVSRRG